ncbi:MAG: hypothetical protein K0R17_346 [Rariglobus sp.]|jgi:hypothetical protein|nr:hypothetical protein [Rariglobus sp.]
MRILLTVLLAFATTVFGAPPEPVALENGTAPTKRYEVVLEADKDTPKFQRYEFKGDDSQFPAILIRQLPNGGIVGRLSWPGDAHSDDQPLRSHTTVLWHPRGDVVAINTNERNYAYSSIFALQSDTGKFVEVRFPDYKTLTGFPTPNSDQLRPRGFGRAVRWTKEGHLIYTLRLLPETYTGADPLSHRITLRVTPKGMEVIRREASREDE